MDEQPEQVSRRPRSKRGAPRISLIRLEEHASRLWDIARDSAVARQAFAKHAGFSVSTSGRFSGSYDRVQSALKAFGIIRLDGDNIGLTPLGLQLIRRDDPSQQLKARREAVMRPPKYAELVQGSAGKTLPDPTALALRFEYDLAMDASAAAEAATAFRESLDHAQLLGPNDEVISADPNSDHESTEAHADTPSDDHDEAESAKPLTRPAGTGAVDSIAPRIRRDLPGPPDRSTLADRQPNVSISLDLSSFEVDDVLRILDALGFRR